MTSISGAPSTSVPHATSPTYTTAFPFMFDSRREPDFWDLSRPNLAVPEPAREAFRRQFESGRARRISAFEARNRTRRLPDLEDLRDRLRENVAEVARDLLGCANREQSTSAYLRFGSNGSLKVNLIGRYQGTWKSFETDEKGDLLALIQRERGLNFSGAVTWAREWLGIPADALQALQASPQAAAEAAARRVKREARDAAQEAAQADEDAVRIAGARARWARSIPIDGSIAERYLVETRATPQPDAGWPADVMRFDRSQSELLFAVRTEGGEITAIQRIMLTMTIERAVVKRGKAAKQTRGVLGHHPVLLPGVSAGPVLIAEGPETALSAWRATGLETRAMLGPVARAKPPAGRVVVVLRENDKSDAASRRTADEAVAKWCLEGLDVREVWPAPVYKDLNDQLQAEGIEAVRAAIMDVLAQPEPTPPRPVIRRGADGAGARKSVQRVSLEPGDVIETVTADEARVELAESFDAFLAAVQAYDIAVERYGREIETNDAEFKKRRAAREAFEALPYEERLGQEMPFAKKLPPMEPTRPKPPVFLVPVGTGIGKTRAVHQTAIKLIKAMRAAGDTRSVVITVPRHDVTDETVARLNAIATEMGITIKVQPIRGREAEKPNAPNETMCARPELPKTVQAVHLDTSDSVCQQNRIGAPPIQCPLYEKCDYQRQFVVADIYVAAHNSAFHKTPQVMGEVAAVFVDETPLDAALEGVKGDVSVVVDGLREAAGLIKGDTEASAKLEHLRRRLLAALDGSDLGYLTRDALFKVGLTSEDCALCVTLEYRRRSTARDLGIHPALDPKEIKRAAKEAQHNRQAMVMAKICGALAGFLAMTGKPDDCGRVDLIEGENGERRLRYCGIRNVAAGYQVPTMIADATADAELLRYVWPNLRGTGPKKAVETPHARYIQVVDRAFSDKAIASKPESECKTDEQKAVRKAALNNVKHLRAAIIHRWLHVYGLKPILVIVPKRTEAAILDLGPLPAGISLMHHGNVAGIDLHGRVRALISIGRILAPANAIARKAGALTGVAVSGDYMPVNGRIVAHDAAWITQVWQHPHPIAEKLRWQGTEGGNIQALGRGRAVNRDETCPLDIEIWSDIPLPELGPVEVVSWDELAPSIEDFMASAGAWVENASHAAKLMPKVISSPGALREARSAEGEAGQSVRFAYRRLIISKPDTLARVRYRPDLPRVGAAEAVFLLGIVPDSRALLEKAFGRLALFEVLDDEPVAATGDVAADPHQFSAEVPALPPGRPERHHPGPAVVIEFPGPRHGIDLLKEDRQSSIETAC